MKRKNFPGRKMKRQIDANRGRSKPYTAQELTRIDVAKSIRTKAGK